MLHDNFPCSVMNDLSLVTVMAVDVSAIFCHSRLVEQVIAPPLFLKTAEFRTPGRG